MTITTTIINIPGNYISFTIIILLSQNIKVNENNYLSATFPSKESLVWHKVDYALMFIKYF